LSLVKNCTLYNCCRILRTHPYKEDCAKLSGAHDLKGRFDKDVLLTLIAVLEDVEVAVIAA